MEAGGCYLCVLPLPHVKMPASLRKKLGYLSGTLIFMTATIQETLLGCLALVDTGIYPCNLIGLYVFILESCARAYASQVMNLGAEILPSTDRSWHTFNYEVLLKIKQATWTIKKDWETTKSWGRVEQSGSSPSWGHSFKTRRYGRFT